MATDKSFADFIVDQLQQAGGISVKRMFGEYGLYKEGTIVAFICDDKLFIKPTEAGKKYIELDSEVVGGQPYPGAKMYYLIKDRFEDREWISGLVVASWKELVTARNVKKIRNTGK
jgi:TfoX/Sxy family transcriptional regulator of competence genes